MDPELKSALIGAAKEAMADLWDKTMVRAWKEIFCRSALREKRELRLQIQNESPEERQKREQESDEFVEGLKRAVAWVKAGERERECEAYLRTVDDETLARLKKIFDDLHSEYQLGHAFVNAMGGNDPAALGRLFASGGL